MRVRPPTELTRGWRWFSLVFGVLVPALVWGWLTWSSASIGSVAWQLATVVVEICALLIWSLLPRRLPALELAFSVLFAGGAIFSGYFCLLCLAGLAWGFPGVHEDSAWWLLLLVLLSPFPCLVAYASSASIALWNWHMLPRSKPVPGAG